MISPTRSRDLVSGGLTVLLAALEGAQQTGAEPIVHSYELIARPLALLLIPGFAGGANKGAPSLSVKVPRQHTAPAGAVRSRPAVSRGHWRPRQCGDEHGFGQPTLAGRELAKVGGARQMRRSMV
jgi:hypothetical protein